MRFNSIIFDWSGTLSDDRIPVHKANNEMLKYYGKNTLTYKEFWPKTKGSLQQFLRSIGIKDSDEKMYLTYTRFYEEVTNNGTIPLIYPDAFSTLEKLSKNNLNLSILSSHPQKSLEKEAKIYNVNKFFNNLRGNCQNKSESLKNISLEINHPNNKIVYLGDMEQDIDAARIAGIEQGAVSTGYHKKSWLKAKNPSLGVFNSLTEFQEKILTA